MKTLLFLAHRIPYPPNKGDKIRSNHLVKHLSKKYRLLVGAFEDCPDDWRFRSSLEAYCKELFLLPLHPRRARLRSLSGFLRREALTLSYYRDRRMAQWVHAKVQQGVEAIIVFSSSMAQYAEPFSHVVDQSVVDFVDLDSEKWRQYGADRPGLLGAVYRREANLLSRYEQRVATDFARSVFVSEAEARLFIQGNPSISVRVRSIGNGVDHEFFDPGIAMGNPYDGGDKIVVFTGAMDYWANIDAVSWFAKDVWGGVVSREPGAKFFIVGARPASSVKKLKNLPGVHVTGAVDDIRPYLKFASVAVAPLRVARGIQNKVLEAMAMGLRVIATPAAAEGLCREVKACLDLADDREQLLSRTLSALSAQKPPALESPNRRVVMAAYDWNAVLAEWDRLLQQGLPMSQPQLSPRS